MPDCRFRFSVTLGKNKYQNHVNTMRMSVNSQLNACPIRASRNLQLHGESSGVSLLIGKSVSVSTGSSFSIFNKDSGSLSVIKDSLTRNSELEVCHVQYYTPHLSHYIETF